MLKKSDQKIIDDTANGILQGLLNHTYIELFPINGNYVGIDGMIQLVNEDKTYSSKYLFYQLKGKAKAKNLSFPCSVSHLSHWAKSSTPVIFILVDNDKKIATWEHIDKKYVKALKIKSGQKHKSVSLDEDKVINASSNYLSEWHKIAVGEDELVADEWNQIITNVEKRLKLFVGIFYLLAPVRDGDTACLDKIKELLSIDTKEFTVLLYEALKQGQIKSVGRILIVADEKAGLTGLSEYISDLSKKGLKDLLLVAKDEKQKNVILKRLAAIKDKKSEETLEAIADDFVKEFEKML